MHQYATLEDTVYLWFGANDTSGSGADGATPVYDVRLGGGAAGDIPILSGAATLLSHANYPAGCHEVAIAATAGNGFAAGNTYGVFCTLLVDSQNPTGFVGSFTLGAVAIAKSVWDRVLSGATHNIATSAGRRLRSIQDFGIYDMASVWVDEAAGTSSGTTDGEDGTVANRSDDFDNAQTIAASVGLDNIHIQNGNSITLAATLNGYNVWSGSANTDGEWTLALGGQDVGSTTFGGADVSGIGTGTDPHFHHCTIGTTTVSPTKFANCLFTTTLTLGSAGAFRLIDCSSGVAGAGSPTIDMGAAVGASTLELRNWKGGITLNNLAAGDVVTLGSAEFGTITLNGADAAVEIRGIWKAVVNNLTGSPTVTKSGVEGTDLADVLVDTNELQGNQGDWATAVGFSTHDAAAVYTAFGDGANLTTCATATGFSTHDAAAVYTAFGDGANLTTCATATSVTVSDKTGFSLAADQSTVTIGTVTTNTDVRGTDSAYTGTPPTAIENADAILKRGMDNVEDTADTTSVCAMVLGVLESSISSTTWTIRKTDGTTFVTKTVTVDAAADPITGVT